MTKGTVLKIKERYALVISEESSIHKIKLKSGIKEGQQIYFFKGDEYSMTNKQVIKWGALAASLLIAVLIATMLPLNPASQVNAKAYAVITVDINPSLEIFVDKDNIVLEINALNDDAKEIITEDMIGKDLDSVLEAIISNSEAKGYLLEDGAVLISKTKLDGAEEDTTEATTASDTTAEITTESTTDTSSAEATTSETTEESTQTTEEEDEETDDETDLIIKNFMERKRAQYEFMYEKGTEDAYRAAKSQGLSLGKYEMLKFFDDDITKEEIQEMKISEIKERKQERLENKTHGKSVESSTERKTERTTERTTERITEGSTSSTEASTERITERKTERKTEIKTEIKTDNPNKPVNPNQNKGKSPIHTQVTTEPTLDDTSEVTTESSTETSTQ